MSVTLTTRAPASRITARWAIVAAVLIAGSLAIASLSRSSLSKAVGDAAEQGLSGIKTVAAMLADRSPGQRPEGALASLKHKRQTAVHERALPKVRPAPPVNPLVSIIAPPPAGPDISIPAEPAPLFAMVDGPPVVVQPVTPGGGTPGGGTPGGGTPGGSGPPTFTDIPPPGGGGGVVVPPITTTDVPPVTPAVPEPNTWALMLMGFALMGWEIRRKRRQTVAASVG